MAGTPRAFFYSVAASRCAFGGWWDCCAAAPTGRGTPWTGSAWGMQAICHYKKMTNRPTVDLSGSTCPVVLRFSKETNDMVIISMHK
jgi:hypothetical protein